MSPTPVTPISIGLAVIALAGSVLLVPTSASAAQADSASTSASASASAGVDQAPAHQARLYSFGPPDQVRVTTTVAGMTVYATPHCSGLKSCRSWFTIPGFGIEAKDVTTTNGYFVAWPSDWAEGQSVTGGSVRSFGRDLFGNGWYGTQTTSFGSITRPYADRRITATLASQDDGARSAVVTGTATPFAEIRREGAKISSADQDGDWRTTITGLPIGTTTLVFEQYLGGSFRDRASLTISFTQTGNVITGVTGSTTTLAAGSDTTVYARFRTNTAVTAPFTDAFVTFTAPEGTTFPKDLTCIRGQYRPASGGDWVDFVSSNLTDGAVSGNGRTAWFTWAPSSGTGWSLGSGTDIRFGIPVHNPGSAPGTGTVGISTEGTAPQGRFNATTTTPVRIEAAALADVTITGPDTVSSGAVNTITGTATPGASFEVVDGSGAVIVPGGPFQVDDRGEWAFDLIVPEGALETSFAIRQTALGSTITSQLFTLPADTR